MIVCRYCRCESTKVKTVHAYGCPVVASENAELSSKARLLAAPFPNGGRR
jgi:hypothetical protein